MLQLSKYTYVPWLNSPKLNFRKMSINTNYAQDVLTVQLEYLIIEQVKTRQILKLNNESVGYPDQ